MANPGRLGKDPIFNIGKRVGAYEVSGLRYLGNEVNEMLSTKDFAKEFNAVAGHAMWTINHYSTSEHGNLGYLVLDRDGGPRLGIGMNRFPIELPSPADRLFLIGCKGSFLLFRVFPTMRLLILNLTNGEVRLTPPVPYQAREHLLFGEKNNTQMILNNYGFDYTIIHGHFTNGRLTIVAYNYATNRWFMDTPSPVNTLQGCDIMDPRSMVLTYLEEGHSVFVSVRNGIPVFLYVPIFHLLPPAFLYLFEQNNLCVSSRVGQDWLVVLGRLPNGWYTNLFKLNANWQRYEHISLAPVF